MTDRTGMEVLCEECGGTGKLPAQKPDVQIGKNERGFYFILPDGTSNPRVSVYCYPTEAAALEAARKASR